MRPAIFASLFNVGGPSVASAASHDGPKLDPVQLVLNASIPVKSVLVTLVLFSLLCWVIIGAKALHLRRARVDSRRFLPMFDEATSFESLRRAVGQNQASPFARIFGAGFDQWLRFAPRPSGGPPRELDDAQATHVECVTRRAATREITHLESWMGLLGTIGSTSPFIGLFGTVYGIMDAFLSIGNQQSANLPVVAPKIAEALIATAIGLVAAIPAIMAYNYFARRIQEMSDQLDSFATDVAARAKLGGT